MTTLYPGALDSYSTKVDGVDDVMAADINDPQDAIEALEAQHQKRSLRKIKNGSGATVTANKIGYFDVAGDFVTTATASLLASPWAAVISGGANNTQIVVGQGRVTIELTANCSIGDFLISSTTVGRAGVVAVWEAAVLAVALTANTDGAGGTCEAMLFPEIGFWVGFGVVVNEVRARSSELALGDTVGGGDVDIDFNSGQVFLQGSDGFVGINVVPTEMLHMSEGDILMDRGTQTGGYTSTVIVGGARTAAGANYAKVDLQNYDDGSDYVGARISSQNDGGASDGDLRFFTYDGSLTERVRIGSSGDVDFNSGQMFLRGSDGFLGIGTASPVYAASKLDISATPTAAAQVNSYSTTATFAGMPFFGLFKSHNNTVGVLTATVDTERLGDMLISGVDSNNAVRSTAGFRCIQVGAAAVGDVPSKLQLIAANNVVVMTLDEDKDVVIADGAAPAALGQLHVDQASATAAQPALYLDQADVSEEMIQFESTIGAGNTIEAVGVKTLTVTHFIKCTLPGGLTRYLPVGTIA